jgi:hypothetical protein
MALVLVGAVRATWLMDRIEGGERAPPSMRASEAGRPEQPSGAELKPVVEECGLKTGDVHDDGVGEPGLGGERTRSLETQSLLKLRVCSSQHTLDGARSDPS